MKSQTEMPQKELTIAERVVVLKKIREQPPNISHKRVVGASASQSVEQGFIFIEKLYQKL